MEGVSSGRIAFFLGAVVVASAIGSAAAMFGLNHATFASLSRGSEPYFSCNVLGIQVYGAIVTNGASAPFSDQAIPIDASSTPNYTASNILEDTLRYAKDDAAIKGLFIDVDSGGGSPVAGEEIAKAIRRFGRPSVAVIHEVGASAGYLVASAANTVFASENSNVGSIGVTSSYLSYAEKDKKDGITYEQLSSGPFKDMYSPDKPLTKAERDLIMRDIKISHDIFVNLVAEYRHQPPEKIYALADGSAMMGAQALESGLIDEIGGTQEAIDHLDKTIGEPITICWH